MNLAPRQVDGSLETEPASFYFPLGLWGPGLVLPEGTDALAFSKRCRRPKWLAMVPLAAAYLAALIYSNTLDWLNEATTSSISTLALFFLLFVAPGLIELAVGIRSCSPLATPLWNARSRSRYFADASRLTALDYFGLLLPIAGILILVLAFDVRAKDTGFIVGISAMFLVNGVDFVIKYRHLKLEMNT